MRSVLQLRSFGLKQIVVLAAIIYQQQDGLSSTGVASALLVPKVSPSLLRCPHGVYPRKMKKVSYVPMLLATDGNKKPVPWMDDDPSEREMGEELLTKRMEKDQMMAELSSDDGDNNADVSMFGTFDSSNFDESALPVPLFTAVIILLGSLYVTGYGFYVGIFGFPTDTDVPRIF